MAKERIYRSSNGDTWDLIREGGEAFVEHLPNPASGGAGSLTPLSDFLQIAPHSAEHLALLTLIGVGTDTVPREAGAHTKDFTVQQAVAAQDRLRAALGLPPEVFPVPAFISMISDEIEQMRAAGRTDKETASIVEEVTGIALEPGDIMRYYVADRLRPASG